MPKNQYPRHNLRISILVILILSVLLLSQTQAMYPAASFQGQLSGWVMGHETDELISQTGFRYIPELFIEAPLSETFTFDLEAAASISGSLTIHDGMENETAARIHKYRLWGRISRDQFEVRIGLQKINFGSATLFRPLQWFDRMDPRDPLNITEGVYGVLMRYYFQNNANIWLWGLYGNNDIRGQEIAPTRKGTPEFGGRLQVSVYTGEMGLTYHHKEADFSQLLLPLSNGFGNLSVQEDRLGLDGKWDIGVGVWFEGSLTRHQTEISSLKYQQALTVGIDYTFDVGNGLNTIGEYHITGRGDNACNLENGREFLGASVTYPLGLLDSLSSIVYYDMDHQNWYRTVTWQRLFDDWRFFVTGFWNPGQAISNQTGNAAFSGKGLQIMVVFNH